MNIAVIGIHHNSASAAIREKASFTQSSRVEALDALMEMGIQEAVILSTCNRSEIYIADWDRELEAKVEWVKAFIIQFFDAPELEAHLFTRLRRNATHHVYAVAVGLDSVVVGEDQILGQLKDAHALSMDVGASGKVLNKVIREAVSTAKRIKHETGISDEPVSVSSIGVRFLKEEAGGLAGKKALIVGTGKMGQQALNYLRGEQLDTIIMTNRTHHKSKAIQQTYPGVSIIPYDARYETLKEVDVLITATSSPHVVIDSARMPERENPLTILDMAMPRDVDPEIGKRSQTQLYVVDDLREISERNMTKRRRLCEQALQDCEPEIKALCTWLKTMRMDPVISQMKERADKISEDTLEYLGRKLELDTKEYKLLDKMVHSAVKRMIREPILQLKAMHDMQEQEQAIALVEKLFMLEGE